jgi:type III secretory pathway component EscU
MHPLVKSLLGIIIVIIAFYYIFAGVPGYLRPALSDVIALLNGAIPLLGIVLGVFVVWLYLDDWKMERELAKEEKRSKKEGKKE